MIALADDFDTVGRRAAGSHIGHEAFADTSPTGLFAAPLNAATGPGELVAVEQPTAGANHPIGEVGTGALENLPRWPGMHWIRRQGRYHQAM
jgi:hypothetical protein